MEKKLIFMPVIGIAIIIAGLYGARLLQVSATAPETLPHELQERIMRDGQHLILVNVNEFGSFGGGDYADGFWIIDDFTEHDYKFCGMLTSQAPYHGGFHYAVFAKPGFGGAC